MVTVQVVPETAVRTAQAARRANPDPETLPAKAGGDRPRRTHGHAAGRARDRIAAAAPGGEGGAGGRRRREDDRAAARVGGRAGGPAVDPTIAGGDRAAAAARRADREGERLPAKAGGRRSRRTHANDAGRARDRI